MPLGKPSVPLPLMMKLPPEEKVPPMLSEPVSAPVVKETLPRSPVSIPPPPKPLTAINSEPLSDRPPPLADKVPPLLVKSMLLPAKAAIGRASATASNKRVFFIVILLGIFNCQWPFRGEKTTQLAPGGTEVPALLKHAVCQKLRLSICSEVNHLYGFHGVPH